jgi:phage-related protein
VPGPEVTVQFKADTAGVEQAGGKVSGALGGLKSAAMAAAGAFAAVKLVDFAKDAVAAASNLNESASKVQTVFGSSARTIQAWSKTTATSMGLSQQEALDAAGAFGNMFTQIGVSTDQAAAMSTTMSGLAADFASFHNADITDVLEAQQAAFRGEYDAVQKFVPTINAAAVQQRAMADTGKQSADQLTANEKAMAAYALMVEGAGSATGDFARTSDGMANQQRIMSAQWKDAQATLGQALLPVLTDLAGVLTDTLIPAFASFAGFLQDNIGWIGPLAAAFATVVVGIKAWTIAQAALNVVLSMNPIALIVIAIAALIAGLVLAYNKVDWFRSAVDTMARAAVTAFNFLWDIIKAVFGWIADHWQLLITILAGPIGLAVSLIVAHWDKVKVGLKVLWDFIQVTWDAILAVIGFVVNGVQAYIQVLQAVWNALSAAAGAVSSAISAAFSAVVNWFRGTFGPAISAVVSGIKAAWDGLVSAARLAASWVSSAFEGVVSFFQGIVSGISRALSGVYEAIIGPFKKALDWLGDIPGKIKSIIDKIPGAGAISNVVGSLNPFSAPAPGPGPVRGGTAGVWGAAALVGRSGVAGLMPAPAFAGMGGRRVTGHAVQNTYHIEVNVAPNHNPVEVGRAIVRTIRAFEGAAGSGWRT